MTCEEVVLALDDRLGQQLEPEIEAHVEACAACGSYAAFLRDLPGQIAALPREMAPPADLWPGIRERIENGPVTTIDSRRRRLVTTTPWWAVAAALLVGLGAGALWMKSRPVGPSAATVATTPVSSAPSPTAPLLVSPSPLTTVLGPSAAPVSVSPSATAAALPASYQTGAAEYAQATAELMAALDARKSTMTPETRAAVSRNLAVIDAALQDIREALAKDPHNRDLLRLFGATRRRKIDTLRLVVKLTA